MNKDVYTYSLITFTSYLLDETLIYSFILESTS